MRIRIYICAFILILVSGNAYAQDRFVALDVNKIIGFKRIRYFVGDDLYFKDATTNRRYKGKITALNDSLIYFGNKSVNIKDVKVVYRDNGTFVNKGLGKFCMVFGLMFVSLDTFNNFTNKRQPIVNEMAVKEGAIFFASGTLLYVIMKRHYKIGKRNNIKTVNLSIN